MGVEVEIIITYSIINVILDYHLLMNTNSDFNMCVLGSTLANFSFNSAYSGLVGSDDLECFYTNRGAWKCTDCFYACCMCDVSSGFDANKNEVILLANSPVVSSLEVKNLGKKNYWTV